MNKPSLPLGIRLNNPGNIERGDPWQGLAVPQTHARFCEFVDPVDGIRAIARTLITYQDKRQARDGSRIDSVMEIIERWAPPEDDNPTEAYARGVAQLLRGIEPGDEVIDVHDYDHLRPIIEGIIRHENGRGPLKNDNTWYTTEQIDEALRRAGVVQRQRSQVTQENAATVGVGAVGAAQLADIAPEVMGAFSNADSHISSGDMVRVVFGVVTVGIAVYIAWLKYRKVKAGAA